MTKAGGEVPSGELLGDKFRVGLEIGRGGMATVYAAEHVELGKAVAVKLLAAEYATSRTVTERFLREARAAAKIVSPYVCEVYDVGTYSERPFIVMELLEGESLYEHLARVRRLTATAALQITTHVAKGLKKAHQMNIVHRDLKPENIFLTTGEDNLRLTKVVDFGLAKFYEPQQESDNARLTKEGALFGTPAYMSPEQASGKSNVDGRSDLWALGCIVYEMLTGRTVWEIDQGVAMILAQVANAPLPNPRRFHPDLPQAFEDWFKRALARNVDERFPDADTFILELERALSGGYSDSLAPHGPAPVPALGPKTPDVAAQGSTHNVGEPGGGRGPEEAARVGQTQPVGVQKTPVASGASVMNPPSRLGRRQLGVFAGCALGVAVIVGVSSWAGKRTAPDSTLSPAEVGRDAELVSEAQQLLFDEQPKLALEKFQAAFSLGQGKAARSLLTHSSVALDSSRGSCVLRALGHPREFGAISESSKPSALQTDAGLVITWADSEGSEGHVHARAALADPALRRAMPAVNFTPEATRVREPELFAAGEKMGLLYWDFAGSGAGVYVRNVDLIAGVNSAPCLVSSQVPAHPYYPAIAREPDGSFWVVWVEPSRPGVHDLFVRKLSPALVPLTKPVAITGYASSVGDKVHATRPSIQVVGDMLFVAFSLRRTASQQVQLLRVTIRDVLAENGVVPARDAESPGDEDADRFLGDVKRLGPPTGKHDRPTLRCHEPGCFVAWEQVPLGAWLAHLNGDGGAQWSRQVSAGGTRPGMGLGHDGGLVAWYESGEKRVKVAPFTSEALGDPSVVGRVSSVLSQPTPQVVRVLQGPPTLGNDQAWVVGWSGYEAAVEEPFVARVECH
ncbi:MAG: hypothetical protein RJA70_4613 [Pseudomonadota bacterium]|jgi:serine/threonine-protein kinase